MQKSIYSLLIIFVISLLASCASTKSAKENSPEGQWDYTIKGTPQGDFAGIMTISKTGAGYTGQLDSGQGVLPFTSAKYYKESNKIEAEFEYSGMPVSLVGTIGGTSMTGTVSTSGYDFPFTANKKTP